MAQTPGEQGRPPTLGNQLLYWIEDDAELVHGAGEVTGKPVRWIPRGDEDGDPERCGVVQSAYELLPEPMCPNCRQWHEVPAWDYPWDCPRCGARLPAMRSWQHYKLSRVKGWSKSGFASKLVVCEAVGPVLFDGWDEQGEPVARPHPYPVVRCFATEEGQSGQTYGPAAIILKHLADSGWGRRSGYKIDPGVSRGEKSTRTFIHTPDGAIGRVEPRTASSDAAEGGQTSFATADETQLWTAAADRELYRTEVLNVGKSGKPGWVLETGTQYRPGEGSVAETTALNADDDVGVRVDHRGMRNLDWLEDREKREIDREAFAVECDYAYGDAAEWAYSLPQRLRMFQRQDLDLTTLILRYCNFEVYGGNKYIFEPTWRTLERDDLDGDWQPPEGEHVVLGFDGSLHDDHTGLVGVHVPSATLFVAGHWDPADNPTEDWPEGEVPQQQVSDAVDAAFRRWGVTRLYPDPPGWQSWVAYWQRRHGDAVKPFWTKSEKRMTAALRALKEAVASEAVAHVGHPALTKHLTNAVLVTDAAKVNDPDVYPDGKKWRLAKPTQTKHDPDNKIDLGVASVPAWAAYLDAVAAGDEPQRQRRRTPVFG